MSTRRSFLQRLIAGAFGLCLLNAPFAPYVKRARGENAKTVVPKGTPWTDLRNRNPNDLDTSELDLTPLEDFGTMGLDDQETDLQQWRLIVDGEAKETLSLTYSPRFFRKQRALERDLRQRDHGSGSRKTGRHPRNVQRPRWQL